MRLRRGAAQPPRRGSCPGQVGACSTHVTQHPQEIRRVLVRSTPSSQGAPRSQVWHRLATGRPPGLGGGGQGGRARGEGIQLLCQLEKNPNRYGVVGTRHTGYTSTLEVGGGGGGWKLRVPDNIQGSPMPLSKSLPPSQPSYFLQPMLLMPGFSRVGQKERSFQPQREDIQNER